MSLCSDGQSRLCPHVPFTSQDTVFATEPKVPARDCISYGECATVMVALHLCAKVRCILSPGSKTSADKYLLRA
eukprot:3773735-Amphidinium_carterae.1